MLFAGTYTLTQDRDNESARESLYLFTQWTPPAGFTFTTHLFRADSRGGVFIAEVESTAALLEASSVFGAYFDFNIWPVVESAEAVPVLAATGAWVDATLDAFYEDDEDVEDDD